MPSDLTPEVLDEVVVLLYAVDLHPNRPHFPAAEHHDRYCDKCRTRRTLVDALLAAHAALGGQA